MKKQKQTNDAEKLTILFGYGLFTLLLASLAITTVIPWIALLFVPEAKQFNIVIFTITLIASAVLPALLSYFLGDQATHTKGKLGHHFNGILFGVAAYWIALFISFIGSNSIGGLGNLLAEPWPMVVNNIWQIAAVILIMGIVAAGYARWKKKASVLEYLPYQAVLLGGVAIVNIYAAANTPDANLPINTFLTFCIPAILVIFSYYIIPKSLFTRSARFTLSIVSMSLAFISAHIVSGILSYAVSYNDLLLPMLIIGVVVMIAYLLLLRRRLA